MSEAWTWVMVGGLVSLASPATARSGVAVADMATSATEVDRSNATSSDWARPALRPVDEGPMSSRVLSVTFAPAWLSVGFLRVDGEFRVARHVGVKAAFATFGTFDLRDSVLGAQLNWYVLGRFERGWQLGLEYVAGQKHASTLFVVGDDPTGAKDTEQDSPFLRIALFGPHIGYKYIAHNGLTLELQLGVHGAWVRKYAAGVQMSSQWRALPVVATNFGWSI